jgi:hypothetical protein
VSEIPCDNRIRELTGGIETGALSGEFMDNLRPAEEAGALKEYRVSDGGGLLATDGLWYHASQKVRCAITGTLRRTGRRRITIAR